MKHDGVQDQVGTRILVVDDVADICMVCAIALRREHYHVETANDANEALDLLAREPFDLLLTDIAMPTMTGLELARHAQVLQPSLDVVIMTGQPSYTLLEDALQQGVADYLPKPFEVEQLRITIKRTLQRQALRRENMRLRPMTHVVEAGEAFANSLERSEVAQALVAAIRRETGLECVHVVLGAHGIIPAPGAHANCIYQLDHNLPDDQVIRLPLRAHHQTVGEVWLGAPASTEQFRETEVLHLLLEHGSLALYNADTYAALSDLDRQKSEFIALASHELRTPLSVVLGYGGMLQYKLEGKQGTYIQEIVRAAMRINDLVDDLINLRQLQQNERPIKAEPTDLKSLLASLFRQLEPFARSRDIQFMMQAPRRPITLQVECDRLLLALAHLIINGIRFTPAGGRVSVLAGIQRPEYGGNLVIAVDDTGIGIEPYEVQRIFKRFYQVADSRTREEGGLGIGLALARGIIELHGGTLSVRSAPGRGSRFTVTLPATLLSPSEQRVAL